jgi:hypothetical protein
MFDRFMTIAPSSGTGRSGGSTCSEAAQNERGFPSTWHRLSMALPIIVVVASDVPNGPHYYIRFRIMGIESFQEAVRRAQVILQPPMALNFRLFANWVPRYQTNIKSTLT